MSTWGSVHYIVVSDTRWPAPSSAARTTTEVLVMPAHRMVFVKKPGEATSGRSKPPGVCKPIDECETVGNISESSLMLEMLEDWIAPFRLRANVL